MVCLDDEHQHHSQPGRTHHGITSTDAMPSSSPPSSSSSSKQRPLSYTPYQSHRRTGSTQSVNATPSIPSSLKPPPPLRRLASATQNDKDGQHPAGATSSAQHHVGQQLSSRNLNGTAAPNVNAIPGPSSSSSAQPQLPQPPIQDSLPPAAPNGSSRQQNRSSPQPTVNGHTTSHHQRSSSTASQSSHRTNTPIPHGLPSPRHAPTPISTSQALRLRQQQGGGPSSPSSSADTPVHSRDHSPVPWHSLPGGGASFDSSSLQGFDAMYAAQQQQNALVLTRPQSHAFQPRGMTRSRLADFTEAKSQHKKRRTGKGDDQEEDVSRYQERIKRRVDKLIAIHDPNASLQDLAADLPANDASAPTSSRFSSSLLSTLAPHSRFLTTLRATSTLRSLEQSLVPWQADDIALECPICKGSFGVTKRRKHHCRACGRVVCGQGEVRDDDGVVEKCSVNVIRDEHSGIKEAPSETQSLEDILNGSGPGPASQPAPQHSSFRLCLDCKRIILRNHYMQSGQANDESQLPPYIRLYNQLTALETQIEQSLPEFQELVMGLQRNNDKEKEEEVLGLKASGPNTTLQLQRDAASARKQLLANFANYDLIAKRIRNLDSTENPSLKRITSAIERKAAAFLQANMFPLQSIPKPQPKQHKKSASTASTSTRTDAATIAQLEVLAEQRDQIASFLSRAQKERKLNDVPLLKRNLDELEKEMERVRLGGAS